MGVKELEAEIERLRAEIKAGDDAWHEMEETNERLRAALKPLLDHYLNCYDGIEDQLSKDALAALAVYEQPTVKEDPLRELPGSEIF